MGYRARIAHTDRDLIVILRSRQLDGCVGRGVHQGIVEQDQQDLFKGITIPHDHHILLRRIAEDGAA